MRIIDSLSNIFYRKQKVLEVSAVFLFFSIIAFKVNKEGAKSAWSDYPMVMIVLALLVSLLAIIWIRTEKQKNQRLIEELKNRVIKESFPVQSKMDQLSTRQKEVLDLIINGKSNKEITSQLVIELSTLKTHINQIYKILDITTRKQAQSLGNTLKQVL